MKKVFLTLLTLAAFAWFNLADAQIKTPAPSPGCKIVQTAGLTDITIEYSRPSTKGRKIFGGLVPYGEMWRTGANKNTMVTFSEPVKIGGKDLKAGSYAIFTVPGEKEWDIIIYSDTENWGTPEKYDAAKEAARFKVPVETMPFVIETFMVEIGDINNTSCSLGMGWENTWVSFNIDLNTDEKVSANIKQVMAGTSSGDYYNAGNYYFEAGKDLKQAYEWIHKSNEMDGADQKFWKLRKESLVLADLGKVAEAIAVAEKSLALAVKADNKDYVRMNNESIAMWKEKMKSGKSGGK